MYSTVCPAILATPDADRCCQQDANAVNFLTEVLDPELWDYSLGMKDKLNKRFNKSHGMLTGKLADTTGMSKNAIPMLAKHGVKAFHIGYNGVGGLPDVNSTFMWKHQQTGTELLTMIEDDYGKEIDVPASSMRASIVKGGGQQEIALVFLYTVDNTGACLACLLALLSFLRQMNPFHLLAQALPARSR